MASSDPSLTTNTEIVETKVAAAQMAPDATPMPLLANSSDVNLIYRHAVGLLRDESVPTNINQARLYFKQAADLGDVDAIYLCACMLYHGQGGDRNHRQARIYLNKAADLGDVDAMFDYAYILKNGVGGDKDLAGARSYFTKAADLGHQQALAECLKRILDRGMSFNIVLRIRPNDSK